MAAGDPGQVLKGDFEKSWRASEGPWPVAVQWRMSVAREDVAAGGPGVVAEGAAAGGPGAVVEGAAAGGPGVVAEGAAAGGPGVVAEGPGAAVEEAAVVLVAVAAVLGWQAGCDPLCRCPPCRPHLLTHRHFPQPHLHPGPSHRGGLLEEKFVHYNFLSAKNSIEVVERSGYLLIQESNLVVHTNE